MKAGYVQAPFKFEVRDIILREIKEDEVLVQVKACSLCGHDMILASYAAKEMQQFGHEIAGIVEKTGRLVHNVKPGDTVVLESGTFDRFSDAARNARVDLDNNGPNFWVKDNDNMGFAEKIIVPMEVCVKFEGISFEAASIIEPMGVALDLVKTADIKLGNTVLVMGLGPIGLMAARMAKASGAAKVYATELPACAARIELAKKWGIDEIFAPDEIGVNVDRVLVTAPPKVIPTALSICNIGGIVAFLGIDYSPAGFVTIDSNLVHVNKLQLRASNASPALYFPECIELIKCGIVNTQDLISHTFKLQDLQEAVSAYRDDRKTALKAVMIND